MSFLRPVSSVVYFRDSEHFVECGKKGGHVDGEIDDAAAVFDVLAIIFLAD